MSLEILNHGLMTTIQDLGRPGWFHLGIPVGGAMDTAALIAGNLAVGNAPGAAGLECAFMGPQIAFRAPTTIAVTGADLPILLDGVEQPGWTAIPVRAGQVLSFGYLRAGCRIYLSFAGGIDTPPALGSRSTYAIGALGGLDGRALRTGDVVPLGTPGTPRPGASVPESLRRSPGKPATLRMLPGLYWHRITPEAQAGFFEDGWKVAPEADRMGYRFRGGRPLAFVPREAPFGAGSDPSNIVDSCYPYGSIQVPGGTEPIILHRDAVSGGGYFMIGTVISADMDLIGQLQPHHPVRFAAVDMAEALAARAARAATLAQISAALA